MKAIFLTLLISLAGCSKDPAAIGQPSPPAGTSAACSYMAYVGTTYDHNWKPLADTVDSFWPRICSADTLNYYRNRRPDTVCGQFKIYRFIISPLK